MSTGERRGGPTRRAVIAWAGAATASAALVPGLAGATPRPRPPAAEMAGNQGSGAVFEAGVFAEDVFAENAGEASK